MSSIFPYRVEILAGGPAGQPPTDRRDGDRLRPMAKGEAVRRSEGRLRARSPKVPARTSTRSESLSTATIPDSPVMSRATPPKRGTALPHTPLRPPAGGHRDAGLRADGQHARPPPWPSAGRATAPARAGTSPPIAHRTESGHQSRPACNRLVSSTSTRAQTPRSRVTMASSTVTATRSKRTRTGSADASVSTVPLTPVGRRRSSAVPGRAGAARAGPPVR